MMDPTFSPFALIEFPEPPTETCSPRVGMQERRGGRAPDHGHRGNGIRHTRGSFLGEEDSCDGAAAGG